MELWRGLQQSQPIARMIPRSARQYVGRDDVADEELGTPHGSTSGLGDVRPISKGRPVEMSIIIVTDSTCDLPPAIAAAKGVRVVPLNVHIGEETFLDGVTIKSDEFFRRLKSGPLPKTSQPSAGSFLETYLAAAKAGATEILSIHLSSKISGTYNSAVQAKQELGTQGPRVEVIDTLQASMALGLVVTQVADAVRAGAKFDAAAQLARDLSAQAKFFGLLDTLEYLYKGGRVGKAKLFMGSLLSIKPILGLVDGEAHPIDRARSRQKGIARLIEITRKESPLSALAVLYAEDRAAAESLAYALKDVAPSGAPVIAQFGPVLGTYLGPEALGICLVKAAGA
ncbi:MAG: DegV family protein [Dehalococcoidia bacterium]|nr:DegV family protein [Dehalococcoidia bacterium]